MNSLLGHLWRSLAASDSGLHRGVRKYYSAHHKIRSTGGGHEKINSRERVFPGHLVLTSGLPSSAQQAISKILLPREPVHTVPITPADLPTHALNYDGISALLLIDDGPILNPAQIGALCSGWRGGILVICNPRPGEDGLFSSLTGSTANGLNQTYLKQTNTEQRFSSSQSREGQEELREMIRFGFGRIIKTSLPVNSEEPAYWRDLLSWSHFEEAPRLTAGQIFPEDVLPELNLVEVEAEGKFELRFLIMAWSVLGFTLLYLMKPGKMRLHALCFFTLFSIVSSIPVGGWLNGLWHRGAPIQTQAILLPAGGGVIFSSKTGLPKNSHAWNLRLQLDAAEKGEINRYKGYSCWQHTLSTYTGLLQTSSGRAMTITGVLPVASSSFGGDFWSALSSIVSTGYIGVYDGETWRQFQLDETGQASWQVQTSDTLAWVSKKDLIKRLHQLFPDYKWVYGWSSLPGFHLKLKPDYAIRYSGLLRRRRG